MSEQSPPNDDTSTKNVAPSQDLDPISPESFNSDSNHGKAEASADNETDAPAHNETEAPADNEVEPPADDETEAPSAEAEATTNGSGNGDAADAPTAMDVDDNTAKDTSTEDVEMNDATSAGEPTSEEKEGDTTANVDDSVMEENPEQVNCSNLDETLKSNTSAAEPDPFDALQMGESEKATTAKPTNVSNTSDNIDEHNSSANEDHADDSTLPDDSVAADDGDGDTHDDDATDGATVNGDQRDDGAAEGM